MLLFFVKNVKGSGLANTHPNTPQTRHELVACLWRVSACS